MLFKRVFVFLDFVCQQLFSSHDFYLDVAEGFFLKVSNLLVTEFLKIPQLNDFLIIGMQLLDATQQGI